MYPMTHTARSSMEQRVSPARVWRRNDCLLSTPIQTPISLGDTIYTKPATCLDDDALLVPPLSSTRFPLLRIHSKHVPSLHEVLT